LQQRKAEDVALRALRAADRSRAELDARLERQGFAGEER
jgi:SOS response regulatory protein OraA/RecX